MVLCQKQEAILVRQNSQKNKMHLQNTLWHNELHETFVKIRQERLSPFIKLFLSEYASFLP